MKQALHIKNLTKKYKDFTLDHISLDLPYGMILGLIGENGSGKSTLINSILNIVKADYDEEKCFPASILTGIRKNLPIT